MAKFPVEIARKAFVRQKERCGMCGKRIYWKNFDRGSRGAWHPHHVNGDNTNHRFSNCVCLCVNEPEYCHLEAHCGDFGCDTVLSKSFFDYWNG